MKFLSFPQLLGGFATVGSVVLAMPQAPNDNAIPTGSTVNFVTGKPSATSASRQSSSNTASRTGSANPGKATHIISVGKADHKFTPDSIEAAAGDTVLFQFFPANHSVARAEYNHPCVGWEKFHDDENGMFFSGFRPVDKILSSPPEYSIQINDTEPIFFYCTAPGSCINYQMVGVINPNSPDVLGTQKNEAAQAAYMLQPGEPFPPESGPTSTGSAGPGSTSASGANGSGSSGGSKLSGGAIAGIVIGSVMAVVLVVLLWWLVARNKSLRDTLTRSSATVNPTYHPPGGVAEPQAFQSGGTIFVPIQADSLRHSGVSSPPPPGYMQEADVGSPRNSHRDTFADFGGVYQNPVSGQDNKPTRDPPNEPASAVHEMYAPVPQNPNQP
ncbi:hypothetical protein P152DRAFT_456693 [Eremomyces bilateralis CBS 781.70]|uniref:Extracellular serine-rich protein n=1 Tax=Eremomyces bilateralis CBS 781.70 TaxID=1392243 RepID=A0A6G1G962_9PEZI|nr:uncharacterized protein P152DRAFT_456693 [Eremomyces bilateralis CBS 781.70]KAF1814440.1 hypothetical protein P152DRAFT_456693 [Eremomyces bilateralis CBS 781.70]